MEAASSSETLLTTYQSIGCHIPEDLNLHKHNLLSLKYDQFLASTVQPQLIFSEIICFKIQCMLHFNSTKTHMCHSIHIVVFTCSLCCCCSMNTSEAKFFCSSISRIANCSSMWSLSRPTDCWWTSSSWERNNSNLSCSPFCLLSVAAWADWWSKPCRGFSEFTST